MKLQVKHSWNKDQTTVNPSLLGILASSHAISVKYNFTSSGGASGGFSGEGILILAGPHTGTLVIIGSGNAGVGSINVSLSYNVTSYTYNWRYGTFQSLFIWF